MSNVMDFLGIDDFPRAPNMQTSRMRPQVGTMDPELPPWLQKTRLRGGEAARNPRQRILVRDQLRNQLSRVGLSWRVADWALHQMVLGASPAEIEQAMWDHPEFRERFAPAVEQMNTVGASGEGGPPIGPAEILQWERQAAEIMASANMPAGFYDDYRDFQQMISAGWSIEQLNQRVNDAYTRVTEAPRAVRDAYAELFGPDGDAALVAHMLDPEKAQTALQQEVAQAEVAGAGMQFGFRVPRKLSGRIASAGHDFGSAMERFQGMAEIEPLLRETVGEVGRGDDISTEEGAEALFGLEGAGESTGQIRRREQERQAEFGGGGGAQGSPAQGAQGLGAAQ